LESTMDNAKLVVKRASCIELECPCQQEHCAAGSQHAISTKRKKPDIQAETRR
jgi:hypothetical protein